MSRQVKTSRDETGKASWKGGGRGGRPRRFANAAEKHRAHRARKAQKAALLEELLAAVRNAELEDPQLQQVVTRGDDAAVLQGLIAYYQARNWNRTGWGKSKQTMAEEP